MINEDVKKRLMEIESDLDRQVRVLDDNHPRERYLLSLVRKYSEALEAIGKDQTEWAYSPALLALAYNPEDGGNG